MRYIKYFEGFDIKNVPTEEVEFLKLVKDRNPDIYSKFYSLVRNKGLEIAKKNYLEYDDEYRAKDTKEKNKLRKISHSSFFSLDKEDFKYYIPGKIELNKIFNTNLLNEQLNEHLNKFGINSIKAINGQYEPEVSNYNATLKFKVENQQIYNVSLGDLVTLIEGLKLRDTNELRKVLNGNNSEGTIHCNVIASFFVSLSDNFKSELQFNVNYTKYTPSGNKKRNEIYNLVDSNTETQINQKIPKKYVTNSNTVKVTIEAQNYLNLIQDKINKMFIKTNQNILSGLNEPNKEYETFINELVNTAITLLNNSGNNIHYNLTLISKHFPKAYSRIKAFYNSEDIDASLSMGDAGF